MGKETVRYPDPLVTRIEELVANSDTFESKSEFHRFASDFLLTLVDPDHDPTVLGYRDILQNLETDRERSLIPPEDGAVESDTSFLSAYIQVRRYLLHGELDAARTYVNDTFERTAPQALLLDELIGRHRQDTLESSTSLQSTDGRSAESRPANAHTPDEQTRNDTGPADQHSQSAADRETAHADEGDRKSDADPPEVTSLEQSSETGQ